MNYWQYLVKQNNELEVFARNVFGDNSFAYEWNEFIKIRNLKNKSNATFNKSKQIKINYL